jgi:hypothetical protein
MSVEMITAFKAGDGSVHENQADADKRQASLDFGEAYEKGPRLLSGGSQFAFSSDVMEWLDESADLVLTYYAQSGQSKDLLSYAAAMKKALLPMAKISAAYFANSLDEARPEWGKGTTADYEAILVAGRGGKRLLTLAQCIEAANILREID